MPLRFAVSEKPATTLPAVGQTQSIFSAASSAGAGFASAAAAVDAAAGETGRDSAGAGSARATTGGGSGAATARCASRRRLLAVRLLQQLRLGLQPFGAATGAADGRTRRRCGAPAPLAAVDSVATTGGGVAQRRGGDAGGRRRRRLAGRGEPQHLPDPDQVQVLDVVPAGELAVIEAVIERDRVQRVAALHRVGRRSPVGLGRRTRGRGGGLRRGRGAGRRGAILDRRRRARRTGGERQRQQRDGGAARSGRRSGRRVEGVRAQRRSGVAVTEFMGRVAGIGRIARRPARERRGVRPDRAAMARILPHRASAHGGPTV